MFTAYNDAQIPTVGRSRVPVFFHQPIAGAMHDFIRTMFAMFAMTVEFVFNDADFFPVKIERNLAWFSICASCLSV